MSIRTRQVKSYFDQTQHYLKNTPSIRLRTLLVRELLGELDGCRIVDLGSGDGSISLQYLSPTNYLTLIDLSDQMLLAARQNTPRGFKENIEYLNLDFLCYDPIQSYDVVLCLGLLAHVPSVEKAIEKISGFLRPGGRCILQFTDHNHVFARLNSIYYSIYRKFSDHYPYQVNHITFRTISKSLDSNNLKPERERRYSLLLPGFGRLPESFFFRYQLFIMQTPAIARFGTEVVLLLSKDQG